MTPCLSFMKKLHSLKSASSYPRPGSRLRARRTDDPPPEHLHLNSRLFRAADLINHSRFLVVFICLDESLIFSALWLLFWLIYIVLHAHGIIVGLKLIQEASHHWLFLINLRVLEQHGTLRVITAVQQLHLLLLVGDQRSNTNGQEWLIVAPCLNLNKRSLRVMLN